MSTKPQPKHRMDFSARRRHWPVTRFLTAFWAALVGLFTNPVEFYGPTIRQALDVWDEMPFSTRLAVGWTILCALFVDALVLLLSGVPHRWWVALLVLGIAAVLVTLIIEGACAQVAALRKLAQVMARTSTGGPVVHRDRAHCGCVHEWLWNETSGRWMLKTVTQSSACQQTVTI